MIRMRSLKRLASVMACLMLVITAVCFAASPSYADDEEYTYKIKVYSGKEGSFGDGVKVKEYTCTYGQNLSLNLRDLGIEVNDSDTYYVRGLKVAGHDNDEFSRLLLNSYTYNVTGDESFSVAYGLKGGMVKYTVNYVDQNGNALLDSEDFYGMPGDKPVVSFRYVEGYTPNAYNLGKTLTENEADNVFTFVYSQNAAADNGNNGQNGVQDGGQIGGGAANAAGGANAAGNAGDGNNGPAQYQDLDDNAVPLAEPDVPKTEPDSQQANQHKLSRILMFSVILALILLLIALLIAAKRRRDENKENAA